MKKVMATLPNLCGGCRFCEVVCSFVKHGVSNTKKSAIRVVSRDPGIDVPVVCRQCRRPVCGDPCPVKAIYWDDVAGSVTLDRERCFGCGDCVGACPFGAITMHPDVPVAIKCDLCGGDPECVKHCYKEAIAFQSDELVSQARRSAYVMKNACKVVEQKWGLSPNTPGGGHGRI